MDRFDAMQAFVRVVDAGSFTKAAETLRVSKTTVTHLVQQLESRLRVKLLHRTTRQVKPTAEGAAYYERALQILVDVEDADTSLFDATVTPKGRLRVDVPSPFARFVLVPALPDFHKRYPDLQLDLGVSDRKVNLVGDNVDCVIRGGSITDPSLVARKVGDLVLRMYASPSYLARMGIPAHPSDLEGSEHRVVAYMQARSGRSTPIPMHRRDETVEVQGRYVVAVDDGNAYLEAGLVGMGALWLPTYMAQAHVDRGELVQVFGDWQIDPMPMYLAYPPNRHVSAKLRVFIEWMVELMGKTLPPIVAGPKARKLLQPKC